MSYRLVNNVDLTEFPSPLPNTFDKVDVVTNAPIKTGVPLKLVDQERETLIKNEMEAVQVSNRTLGPVPLALLANNQDNEPDPAITNSTLNSFIIPKAPTVDETGTFSSQPFRLKGIKRTDNDNDRDGNGINDILEWSNKSKPCDPCPDCGLPPSIEQEDFSNMYENTRNVEHMNNPSASVFQHCNYGGYEVKLSVGQYTLGQLQRLGVKNDDLSSIKPNGLIVTVYQHDNFGGRSLRLTNDKKCLVDDDDNWNDIISSIKVEEVKASVFQHCNYGGYEVKLAVGEYTKAHLQRLGARNNDLSSIKSKDLYLSLFTHDNFTGKRHVVRGDSKCLVDIKHNVTRSGGEWNWNDRVSSIIVSKERPPSYTRYASVFQHCDYKGYEIRLTPGNYTLSQLRRKGLKNDDISSVKTYGLNVILYEHDNYEGKRLYISEDKDKCFTNDVTEGLNWNDNVSSIRIMRNKQYREFIAAEEAEARRKEQEAAERREREAAEKLRRGHTVLNQTEWECVGTYGAPMKIGEDGEVHCMSGNDKDCMWGGNCQAKLTNPVNEKSLSCGAEHNEKWNSTGYNNSRHWCSVSKKHFEDKQQSVHLYEHINYQGKRVNLPVGEYNSSALKDLGIHKEISSIKTNNLVVRMFSRKLGKGKKVYLAEDDANLTDNVRMITKKGRTLFWNDRMASVKVMTREEYDKIMAEEAAREAEKQRKLAEKAAREAEEQARREAEEAARREAEALKAMDGEWVRGATGNKKIISSDELEESVRNCKLCSIINRNGCSMENITDKNGDTRRVKTCTVKCQNPKPDCMFVNNPKPGENCCDRLDAMQGKCCSQDYAGHCTRCGKKVTLDEEFIAETFQANSDEIEGFGATEIGIAVFIIALIIAVIVYLKKSGRM